ncbi:conjugal transfer protein TraF [Virgibacillus profundi]|uniref:conjugal transfer protein TraF n=1 Tax=Virgibacillus profundi TaxID=2024555 RepID=UPI0013FE1EDD|nr:conjugal transfer protein TraF [Virgibacillus profundi]
MEDRLSKLESEVDSLHSVVKQLSSGLSERISNVEADLDSLAGQVALKSDAH